MCVSFAGAAGEKSEGEEAAEGSEAHGVRCRGSGEAAAGLARGIGFAFTQIAIGEHATQTSRTKI